MENDLKNTLNTYSSNRTDVVNATYKVNSLIKKGYVKKVQSDKDKREFYLDVTDRYYRYYNINEKYLDIVENRLKETLSEEEFDMFNNTLKKIYNELMPEVGFGE